MWSWFCASFSTREISFIIWAFIALFFAIKNVEVRESFLVLIKLLLKKSFVIIYAIFGIYVTGQVYILQKLGIWSNLLVKDLIIWVFTFGLVSIVNINTLSKDSHFIKSILRNILKLISVVEFIVNLYTFSIYVELLLVPFVFLASGILAYSEIDAKYKPVRDFLNGIFITIGFGLVIYLIRILVLDYESLLTQENLLLFVFPVYLSITFIPFLYIFALYVVYEELIVIMRHILKKGELSSYFTKKLIMECKFSLKKLILFNKNKRMKIIRCRTIEDINNIFNSKAIKF